MVEPLEILRFAQNDVLTGERKESWCLMDRYFVYIMTNWYGNVMYVGVTNDIERRVNEHRNGGSESFTCSYNVKKLVHFEECDSIADAIAREKQIKGWTRKKKNKLVENTNPEWRDLAPTSC